MDRWTWTFAVMLAVSIGLTGFTGTQSVEPSAAVSDPAKTSWPALSVPKPVTP